MPTATDILSNLRELLSSLQLEDIETRPEPEVGRTAETSRTTDPVKDIHAEFLALAKRVGASAPANLEECLCDASGLGVKHATKNPVGLPVGTPIGSWFDVLNTSDGQRIAHMLGPRSGFFAEYQNWAPLVCHLFDFTVHTANLGLSTEISAESRLLIEPLAIV